MKGPKITWQKALGTAVACVILFFMIRALRSGLQELGTYRLVPSPWRIAAAFGVFAVLFPVYGALWQFMLSRFGYAMTYGKCLRIWLLSQAGRYVPGKVWFALGRIYLLEREGIPKGVTTVATGLELALVLGSGLVAFGLTSLVTGTLGGHPYAWSVLLVPLIVAGVHPNIVRWVLARFRMARGEFRMRYADILKMLAAYVGCWGIYGIGFYFAATAVRIEGHAAAAGAPVDAGLMPQMIGINALSWTVGFLSVVTPAGLGVREGVAFSLLSKVVAKPYPSLIPLVARAWVTVAEVGAIAIAAMPRGGKGK